jgi:hypothetical protein
VLPAIGRFHVWRDVRPNVVIRIVTAIGGHGTGLPVDSTPDDPTLPFGSSFPRRSPQPPGRRRTMTRIVHVLAASLVLVFLSAGHAAAQPSSEESISVWADVFATGNMMDVAVYTVPAGKQLIIDNVSMHADVPAGELVIGASINLPAPHIFVVTSQGTSDLRSYFAAAQSTRIVVGANETIVFRVRRSNHGTGGYAFVAIAGRLLKS